MLRIKPDPSGLGRHADCFFTLCSCWLRRTAVIGQGALIPHIWALVDRLSCQEADLDLMVGECRVTDFQVWDRSGVGDPHYAEELKATVKTGVLKEGGTEGARSPHSFTTHQGWVSWELILNFLTDPFGAGTGLFPFHRWRKAALGI